jgi:hypothetical protein
MTVRGMAITLVDAVSSWAGTSSVRIQTWISTSWHNIITRFNLRPTSISRMHLFHGELLPFPAKIFNSRANIKALWKLPKHIMVAFCIVCSGDFLI